MASVRRQTYSHGWSTSSLTRFLPTTPLNFSRPMRAAIACGGSRSRTRACITQSTTALPWLLATSWPISTRRPVLPLDHRGGRAVFEQHPEADFVVGDALLIDEATGSTKPYWNFPFDVDFVRRYGFITQPAVFWRRQVYESMGPVRHEPPIRRRLRILDACGQTVHLWEGQRVPRGRAQPHGHPAPNPCTTKWKLEIAQLRSRFVRLDGERHRRMQRRPPCAQPVLLPVEVTRRVPGMQVRPCPPHSARWGLWHRMLAAGFKFSRLRAFLSLVPRLGGRFTETDSTFAPATHWLHPDAGDGPAWAAGGLAPDWPMADSALPVVSVVIATRDALSRSAGLSGRASGIRTMTKSKSPSSTERLR